MGDILRLKIPGNGGGVVLNGVVLGDVLVVDGGVVLNGDLILRKGDTGDARIGGDGGGV